MLLLTLIIIVAIIVDATDAPTTIHPSKMVTKGHHRIGDPFPNTTESIIDYADDGQINNRHEYLYEEALSVCIDSLWNTCVGRCGQVMTGVPYVCSCDPMCIAYHDCCIDFHTECAGNQLLFNTTLANTFDDIGQFTCISLSRDWKYGVLMVTTCAPSWPNGNGTAEGRQVIQRACEGESPNSLNPVEGDFGLIFKNVFCSQCNYDFNVKPWQFESSCKETPDETSGNYREVCSVDSDPETLSCSSYRVCSYDVNECPSNDDHLGANATALFSEYARLCPTYTKPVFGVQLLRPIAMYKNIHCAHCHHQDESQLYCPAWELISSSRSYDTSPTIFVFEGGTSADHRFEIPNIPASFAILFYFGHDGNQHTMFSSQSKEWWQTTLEKCTPTQVWDPFGEVCRDLYCSTEFSFNDFHCTQMYNISVDYDDGQEIPSNMTEILQEMDLSIVKVMFDMQLDRCIDAESATIMDQEFINSLATTLNVTSDRFINFTLYNDTSSNDTDPECRTNGASSVLLLDPDPESTVPQPSIEMIMATLSYDVALNQLLLHLDSGINIIIKGIQEKVVQYTNSSSNNSTEEWCTDGARLYYTNGEFTPMVINHTPENTSIYIFINSTGVTYAPGQYIVNILFQGQQRSDIANLSTAAVVCERSNHNNTCLKIMIQQWEYLPLENGSIEYIGNETTSTKVYNPGTYEILPNGDALICLMWTPSSNNSGGDGYLNHNMVVDLQVQSWLTTILLSISSLAMVITIITYLSFAELRNPPGWNMINLTCCLLIYHLVYLAGMRPSVKQHDQACYAVAVLLHYFLLTFFFWMNVIAYDLYKTFASSNMVAKAGDMKYLPRYATYAYSIPLIIVLTCVTLDTDGVAPSVSIGYGEGGACWIGNPMALAIVFEAPTMYVLVCNLFFYVLTVLSIKRIRRKVEMTTVHHNFKEEFIVYTRIFTVMGFTWATGYLAGIPDIPYVVHDIFVYLFIILNTAQGVMIAFAFVVNQKVYELYLNSRLVHFLSDHFPVSKCKECKNFVCNCPKPIVRTISNETCQSVILSQSDHQWPVNRFEATEKTNDGLR